VSATVLAQVLVIDGTGRAPFPADVRIEGERIARVAPCAEAHTGATVVGAAGMVLTPGFVDVHSHADLSPFLAADDTTKLLQGVTTEVTGNCGSSLLLGARDDAGRAAMVEQRRRAGLGEGGLDRPAAVLRAIDEASPVTNQAPLLGHADLRRRFVGYENRPPSDAEMRAMRDALEEALDHGAFGLSSGLFYTPGSYATPDEIAALLDGFGGRPIVYASHIRNEGSGLVAAVDEFLSVGRAARVRLELSHHKAAGLVNWGSTRESLAHVRAARGEGVEVALDAYPYTASSTSVSANLPPWAMEGGREAAVARLSDPASRARIRRDCEGGLAGWESMVAETGYDRMIVARTRTHAGEGRTLAEIAAQRGVAPFDAMADLLCENGLEASMIVRSMDEQDLLRVLADERCWIGSDGLPYQEGGHPHPRLTGTFPRVLGPFVRDLGAFTLEAAVHRMTAGPAAWFGLHGRGQVVEGALADLVLLAPERVADGSTFERPLLPPVGIDSVWLAGERVVQDGRFLGRRAGRRLAPARA
jgi:N-acyl-D-amino-acid deacylase